MSASPGNTADVDAGRAARRSAGANTSALAAAGMCARPLSHLERFRQNSCNRVLKPSDIACVPPRTSRNADEIANQECGGRSSWHTTPRESAKRRQPVSG